MSSMEGLQRDKVRPCIELLNLLRSLRLQQDVALPSIAIIGDKGSGKSSVLETLSGVTLPRGRNYTLTLQMNKTKGDEWNGTIKYLIPENTSFKETKIDPQNLKDVPDLICQCRPSDAKSEDLTIVEITSPDVPDLTLIDLPSIPSVADSKPEIVDQTKRLIKQIIKNPECIILMVVPCNVDIATTEAFKMVQEVDPEGERTLGLLTKPDTVDQVKEKNIVDTVQNKVINLNKGFMIVRCFDKTKMSMMDPNENELKFFKEHEVFKSLYDGGYATFPKLADRLSQELTQHTEKYLPQLNEFVKKELLQANAAIMRCGTPPPCHQADRLTFLTDKLSTFNQDVMRLAAGELRDLTEQRVLSVWRKIVKDSEESFLCKNESGMARHEQPGFSDFQTFDRVIKDLIKYLQQPAIFTLNNSADIVKKEMLKLVEDSFFGFPNLICRAKGEISDLTSKNKNAAEFLLRTQFKMEQFEVQAEERMWINKNRGKKTGPTAQLYSYYQTTCQRLTTQIQMMIRFHIIKESSPELQKKMLQMLNEDDLSDILQYDEKLTTLRKKTEKCFIPLTKAQILLSEL